MTDEPSIDDELFGLLEDGNLWLRSLLCTLARRGVFLRETEPERAASVIATLVAWPLFKGGQFLFDLMEWEDFMVDGPPPPLLATALEPENWHRIAAMLGRFRSLLDSAVSATTEELLDFGDALGARLGAVDGALPPLDPGLYLYRDVVLGAFVSAGDAVRAAKAAREPATPPQKGDVPE